MTMSYNYLSILLFYTFSNCDGSLVNIAVYIPNELKPYAEHDDNVTSETVWVNPTTKCYQYGNW